MVTGIVEPNSRDGQSLRLDGVARACHRAPENVEAWSEISDAARREDTNAPEG
jgi:hypothetical protein